MKSSVINVNKEAQNAVIFYATTAAGIGATPIPIADAPIILLAQSLMIKKINKAYHFEAKNKEMLSLISALGGGQILTMIGRSAAGSLFKLFPGAGSIIGGTINATTAASITLALGFAYVKIIEKIQSGQLDLDKISQSELKKMLLDAMKSHEIQKMVKGKINGIVKR